MNNITFDKERVNNDILTISKMEVRWRKHPSVGNFPDPIGDRLAIENGQLIITKCGWLQGVTRFVKNISNGWGYNRYDVAAYLNELGKNIDKFECNTEQDKVTLEIACTRLDALWAAYHSSMPCICPLPSEERFDDLFWKHYEKNQPKWDATIDYEKIPFRKDLPKTRPKGLTNEKINELKAIEDAKVKNIALEVVKFGLSTMIVMPIVFLPVLLATAIKICIWNPIEFLIRGSITTTNPLSWLMDHHLYYADDSFESPAADKIKLYDNWLTRPMRA